jgi:allantoin racemase
VRASDVPVLDLEKGDPDSRAKIAREIRLAIDEDRAEAIVLGCAGMTDLAASFAEEFALPVLDGVACAVAMAEGIARIGLRTSRRGGYAPPIEKPVA